MTNPGPPPEGIDPLGVPRDGSERDTFTLLLGYTIAVLGLAVTLGWVVYHHLIS